MGLALTTLMVRLMWLSSPPFNTMPKSKLSVWKLSLVTTTILMACGSIWLLSLPADPSIAARNAEEGFQFH